MAVMNRPNYTLCCVHFMVATFNFLYVISLLTSKGRLFWLVFTGDVSAVTKLNVGLLVSHRLIIVLTVCVLR